MKDYYIALAIMYKGNYEFPQKTFYWCSSGSFTFAEMPELNEAHSEAVEKMNGMFSGEYDRILVSFEKKDEGAEEGKGEEGAEDAKEKDELASESEEEGPLKVEPKNLTELDRLAYVVRAIENDTNVVPHNSFKLTPIHEVRRNEAFNGLKKDDALDLGKYYHFRNVQDKEKKDQIERDDAVFHPDFLDSIHKDSPKGCWVLHLDSSKTIVNIRNLLWPGYFAFHKIGTRQFGGCYIGDGRKNKDLPFML